MKGWVDCTEGAAWDAMVFWGRICLCGCCGEGRKRKWESGKEKRGGMVASSAGYGNSQVGGVGGQKGKAQ